jgi:hypothetical protein
MVSPLTELKAELRDYLKSELGELYSDTELDEIWGVIEQRMSNEEAYEWCLSRFSGDAMQRRMCYFAMAYPLRRCEEDYKDRQYL